MTKKGNSKKSGAVPEITEEEIIKGEKLSEEGAAEEPADAESEEEEEEEEEYETAGDTPVANEAVEDVGPINPTTGEPVIPPGTPQPENKDEAPTGTQDSIPGPSATHP